MEAAATPTTVTSPDNTTQEYVQEEPLDSWTPLVDEVAAAAAEATPTGITNDDDTTQTPPLVDGGEVGVVLKLNAADEDVHATMAKTLPRYVMIQSNRNHRYLRFDQGNASIPNALRFAGDYSFGLDTRFEVVPATTGTGLVHIRSLHNSLYLAHFGTEYRWITAMAVKPEEDQSNRHCTLFQPVFMYSNNHRVCRLRHVNTGIFVHLYTPTFISDDFTNSLCLIPNDNAGVFTFIDWKSVVVLPDVIRIKGDNGNDLRAWADGFMDYQVKADNSSLFDYEVSPSRDGGMRLKSVRFGTYWTDMSDSTWVLLRQASTGVHNTATVFLPTIVGDRALIRSLRSNMFCNRHTGERKNHCLATRSTFPDNWSYMEIEEPVLSRRITDIQYRLDAAVIHEASNVTLIRDNTYNTTSQTITAELDVRTTVTNTTEWSNSMTWKLGFTVSFSAGIPKIGSMGLAMSTEVSRETKFGESVTTTQEVGSKRIVPVPPMTSIEGRLVATRASYDIPFSYTVRDVLRNGTPREYRKHDGIFTGRDGYGYDFHPVETPLS